MLKTLILKKIDNSGYNFEIVVGGINTNAPEDTTGPSVHLFERFKLC